MPYKSLTGAYGDTHKVQPAAATVAGAVPSLYALPARFIKTKVRYLTLQYSDPDSNVSGVASFKLDNKDILDSVLFTLAGKFRLDAGAARSLSERKSSQGFSVTDLAPRVVRPIAA